ncbi:hypothetical protein J3B00_003098 [Pseudomonas sp. BP8]|nr:hypothetical protein [Pseudomonas sp. BP8]
MLRNLIKGSPAQICDFEGSLESLQILQAEPFAAEVPQRVSAWSFTVVAEQISDNLLQAISPEVSIGCLPG